MDRIYLSDVRVYGYTGVLPEEKTLGQWFVVDVTLDVDLQAASGSDRLEDTLDYRQAIAVVENLVRKSRFDLVERLAGAIADELLTLAGVAGVSVRVNKPAPPIPGFSGRVAVEISRP